MGFFSEENLKQKCPHCDPNSFALKHRLEETNSFWVVCDVHPLVKGHILIIPKSHLTCIGQYPNSVFKEFKTLYTMVLRFIKTIYGSAASFEHGKIGQTVFHSHVHLLPFKGKPSDIIPEGKQFLKKIDSLESLSLVYKTKRKYLFFTIGDNLWLVDTKIGRPGFFRNRFASALGRPERGDWKRMHQDKKLMTEVGKEIKDLKNQWQNIRL